MKLNSFAAFLIGACVFCSTARALPPSPIFFTNETAFLVSIAGKPRAMESFESLPTQLFAPFSANGVSVSGPNRGIISTGGTCPSDGVIDIEWNASGFGEVIFEFATPIFAFGIDLCDFGTTGPTTLTLSTSAGSQAVYSNYVDQTNGQRLFAGIHAPDASFKSVTLHSTAMPDFVALDRVQFVPVPESRTLGLLATGLLFMVRFRRQNA